jgi:hypothetical protein
MTTEERLADLRSFPTDSARFVEAVAGSEFPGVLVPVKHGGFTLDKRCGGCV